MKIARKKTSAFTLIELLVVISIIGILATLAIPAVNNALVAGQMTGTLNNARQLQVATQMMSLDTANTGDGLQWTMVASTSGDQPTPASLQQYFEALTTNNYLGVNDLRKLLTAPGVSPGSALTSFSANNIAFKFFQVSEQSPSDQPLVVTRNWSGKTLDSKVSPYGNKGFVVFAKGGSGGVFKRTQDAGNTNTFPTTDGYTTKTIN